MKEVSITFSKKELETLVERFFIGEYLLTSDEETVDTTGYSLLQKILAKAHESGMLKGMSYNELDGQYYIPYAMEEALVAEIDDYDEDIFFNSVIDELVQNEMQEKYEPRLLANMTDDSYDRLSKEITDGFVREFETNGYANLRVQKENPA
jgi:hypothetical protein